MKRSELDAAIAADLGDTTRRIPATELVRISNRYFRLCPENTDEMMDLIGDYLAEGFPRFAIATSWAKRRPDIISESHSQVVESWLTDYITGWWECDQFCYRILNPFVYAFPSAFSRVLHWTTSSNPYVRRAAPVSLIAVGPPNTVDYPMNRVLEVCDRLLADDHVHVQKGVGWALKCAWSTFPDETIAYLERDVAAMSRTTYRYALGRMPKDLHARLLSHGRE